MKETRAHRSFIRWWERILLRADRSPHLKLGSMWDVFRRCQIRLDDEVIWKKHGPSNTRREP